jgi:hypothetical protein
MRPRNMRCVRHVAYMEEVRNYKNILVGDPEGRPKHRLDIILKRILKQ